MIFGDSTIQKTHYGVLSVNEDATYEEIRTSYRSAVLNFHPDKLLKTSVTSNSDQDLQDKFLMVKRAWDILSDSRSRAAYDSGLRASRQETEISDDVSFEDMKIEDDGEVCKLFCQCRCGDYYSIDSLELEEMGYPVLRDGGALGVRKPDALPASVVLPCSSCSLKVRLLIDTSVRLYTGVDL